MAEIARTFAWKKMAIISQEESLFLRVRNTACIVTISYTFPCLQVAESLSSIFISENLIVDANIVLNKDAKSFPYDLIDDLVRKV